MAEPDLAASVALVDQLQRALAHQDRAGIVGGIQRLVAQRVPMGAQWQQIARAAADHGESSLARKAMDLYIDASGGNPIARYQKAGLLVQGGAPREAYDLLCTLPENVPDPAVNAYSRGAAAVVIGKLDEARELLERVTVLRPELGQAWLPLSTLVNFADEPALMDRLAGAGRHLENAPAAVRAIHFYALGKAHGDRGEHSQAFAAFAKGAQLKKAERPHDRGADRLNAQAAVRGFDEKSIAAIADRQSQPADRTIFVTGLPRSGTTLVEQILTSHSAVSDGGEINRLRILSRVIGGTDHAAVSGYVSVQGAESAGRLWSHLVQERFPAPGRVVDKSMDTSRFLGLAAALLPDAPIIWMTRDTLDCAWSCFRTHFLAGVDWSYDLADIAFHFRLEDRLLSQWQEILGGRLLVVPYGELVTDHAAWISRILSHCGLSEERQVFAPHENQRAVTTSSVMQVRRPINRDGLGSAEPYRDFLEPFLEAYGEPAV